MRQKRTIGRSSSLRDRLFRLRSDLDLLSAFALSRQHRPGGRRFERTDLSRQLFRRLGRDKLCPARIDRFGQRGVHACRAARNVRLGRWSGLRDLLDRSHRDGRRLRHGRRARLNLRTRGVFVDEPCHAEAYPHAQDESDGEIEAPHGEWAGVVDFQAGDQGLYM